MKNITIAQALVLIACIAAPVVAFKFLDSPVAAGATMGVGMVLNFLLGRPAAEDKPELQVIDGGKQ